ncbi:hypothetical protein HDV57DRAFT_239794 [Trichoderma longibrachiatum]
MRWRLKHSLSLRPRYRVAPQSPIAAKRSSPTTSPQQVTHSLHLPLNPQAGQALKLCSSERLGATDRLNGRLFCSGAMTCPRFRSRWCLTSGASAGLILGTAKHDLDLFFYRHRQRSSDISLPSPSRCDKPASQRHQQSGVSRPSRASTAQQNRVRSRPRH